MISVFIFSSSFCRFLGKTRFEGINMLTYLLFPLNSAEKKDVWDVSRTMAVEVHVVIFVSFLCCLAMLTPILIGGGGGGGELFGVSLHRQKRVSNLCRRCWWTCLHFELSHLLSQRWFLALAVTPHRHCFIVCCSCCTLLLYNCTVGQLHRRTDRNREKDITRCCAMQTI